jgi:hypothetical protein
MEGKMVVKKGRKNTRPPPKRARSSVVDDVHERVRGSRLEHQEGENDDDSDGTIDMSDADDVDSNFWFEPGNWVITNVQSRWNLTLIDLDLPSTVAWLRQPFGHEAFMT